jgi:hypothetical protein
MVGTRRNLKMIDWYGIGIVIAAIVVCPTPAYIVGIYVWLLNRADRKFLEIKQNE